MALTEAEIAEVTALIAANSAPAGSVDAFYLLYAGALVFLMQAGFAMLCAGRAGQGYFSEREWEPPLCYHLGLF